jgi:hypothetical protein
VGKRVTFAFRWRPALPDASDDIVLETAVNGNADAIVTFNQPDFNPEAARFGCQVMRPGELLRILARARGVRRICETKQFCIAVAAVFAG